MGLKIRRAVPSVFTRERYARSPAARIRLASRMRRRQRSWRLEPRERRTERGSHSVPPRRVPKGAAQRHDGFDGAGVDTRSRQGNSRIQVADPLAAVASGRLGRCCVRTAHQCSRPFVVARAQCRPARSAATASNGRLKLPPWASTACGPPRKPSSTSSIRCRRRVSRQRSASPSASSPGSVSCALDCADVDRRRPRRRLESRANVGSRRSKPSSAVPRPPSASARTRSAITASSSSVRIGGCSARLTAQSAPRRCGK